eukprot:3426825-Rhodomonas_salina.1
MCIRDSSPSFSSSLSPSFSSSLSPDACLTARVLVFRRSTPETPSWSSKCSGMCFWTAASKPGPPPR